MLREFCREAHTVADQLPVLFDRPLNDQELHFAVGETLAHLNYLLLRGELTRELSSDQQWRFARGEDKYAAAD